MVNRHKHTFTLIAAMAAMLVAMSLYLNAKNGNRGQMRKKAAKTEQLRPVTINSLISNDLSELPQTRRLDRQVERFMKKWEINGATLAVMKDGRLVYCKGYGYADVERGVKADASHLYRLASVSKLITAVAVMKLYEEGKLALDDLVFGETGILNDTAYLHIRDRRLRRITVEDLLRHRAGFSTRAGDPMFDGDMIGSLLGIEPPYSTGDVVRYASKSRLRYAPGSGTMYSNLGYVVLSAVIEKRSGKPYEQYVREHVLYPAGCYDMHLAGNYYEERRDNEVRYYEPDTRKLFEDVCGGEGLVPKSYGGNNVRLLGGAGGWIASAPEIVRFAAAIDGDPKVKDILSLPSIEYMTMSDEDTFPIGWMNSTEDGDWWRTGSMSGTSALLKHQHDGLTWFFVTNTSSWRGWRFTKMIQTTMRDMLAGVEGWPERDLFTLNDTTATGRTAVQLTQAKKEVKESTK